MLPIAKQVADALEGAHEETMHWDFNPANMRVLN
jgi:hypothetical protein